ncbi:DUF748 domain-containing protein [Bordetella avium]|uniref:DUF748 domain-containing protein n=5 Tax=Bordetella avium TaxID=521 RepID=UPI000E6A799D|nr:DUF748 domain-containing protein [Bordetella avium]RIQ34998.1 DUF748 domain-containing protein [Bordetella avium]RIQ38274.1 DUF748 domain-containing protein [Bordetella avium]RIQ39311.1 DUF748 domain-containing protein [Bordetella avium]RIQ48316.1 DUF748 domain-containing protein [Bordetella avium]RIQ57983.1 DUF748 domain-containing protein [Bordetella avium]
MSLRPPALKLSRRCAKIFGAVVLVVLGLAGLAAWQLPKVLRSALTHDVAAMLGREVSVGDIAFNPFTLTLRAQDLAIAQPQSQTALLKVGLVEVSAAWRSLFWFAPVLDRVRVVAPQLALTREDLLRFNFSDIQQKLAASETSAEPATPPAGLPRFALHRFSLEGGRIELDDKVSGRKQRIDDMSLSLPFLSTFGHDRDVDLRPAVHMRINGSPLDIGGVARPFDALPSAKLDLRVEGLGLQQWADIWPLDLPLILDRALLDSRLQLVYQQAADGPPAFKLTGEAGLRQLNVRETSGAELLRWSALNLRNILSEPLEQKLAIEEIALWAPQAWVSRDARQRINWLEIIDKLGRVASGGAAGASGPRLGPASPARAQAAAPPEKIAATAGGQADGQADENVARLVPATPPGWQLTIDAVNVHDAEVMLSDAGLGLDYPLDGLNLTAENVQWPQPAGQPIRLWADMTRSADGAWLRAKGPLGLHPLALDLQLHLSNLALAPFAPAVLAAVPLSIQDGRLGLDARLVLDQQFSARDVSLSLTSLTVRDEAMRPALDLRLGQMEIQADQLSMGAAPTNFTLKAADIQGKGRLAMQGVLTSAPLSLKSQVDLSGLDLAPFGPYVASSLNATVRAVTVGAQGQAEFAAANGQTPMTAAWRGAAEVSDFDLQDRVNQADFLNWGKLAFSNMQVAVRGDAFSANLGDIVLDDFYGRLLLNAQGSLNVMDLVAEPGQAGGSITQDTQTRSRPAAKASGASAKQAAAMPDMSVNSVTLKRGRMSFTDRFVQPNYTAELSAIEGSISAVSSRNPKPATVKVGGRVYTTAPFSISGTVQPFAQYLALDLKASAKGVDLPRFTTYSAKYMGYPIVRGKLSVDVQYQIKDRALQASNRVILNQLTFGDRTDSKDALKLPVLLAVALLKDSKGNIDINLPISGSLDDPQFSVGGIIARVFVNLIVKAVTSPFTLLASAFGGGEELSYIEFAPGSAQLTAESEKRLQTLAKALNDRPGLKLDIAGRADLNTDEDGLRAAWVERQIRLAKVRDTAGRGKKIHPDGVDVSPAERNKYLEKVYDDTKIEGKPRNLIGMAKSIPAEQMMALLKGVAPISQESLRKLADERAQTVYETLQTEGPADRIFLVAPQLDASGIKDDGKPSRVDFSLK